MDDTVDSLKRRIEELEARLETSKESNDNDENVEEAMAMAEKALMDKEELELVIERQKQIMTDFQLKATAELLNKEIEVASLEAELAKTFPLKESSVSKDLVIEDLERQILEYRSTFDSLKKVCVESARKLQSSEAQLAAEVQRTNELESQFVECQVLLRDHSASLQVLQQKAVIDEELIARSQQIEKLLQTSLDQGECELQSYRNAFQRLSKMAVEKEGARAAEISSLKVKIQLLEETALRNAKFLAPRWQRLADEKALNKVGSKSATLLRSRDAEISCMMLRSEKQFLVACIPPELWTTETHIHNVGTSLARLVYKSDNFLAYVFEAHYVELVADVAENPLSVRNDKGFIRWLNNSVFTITSIMSHAAILLEAFRKSPIAQVKEYLEASNSGVAKPSNTDGTTGEAIDNVSSQPLTDSALSRCLQKGEKDFDRLLGSGENDYLSTSFDLTALETFVSELESIMELNEKTTLGTTVSSIHLIEGSTDFGILPPILSALIRKLASSAVVGLCNAAYSDNASAALSSQVWNGLWQASSHIIDKLPFGHRSSRTSQMDCLSSGFGYLKPMKKANVRATSETFYEKTRAAIQKIHDELCSTTDAATVGIRARMNAELPVIGSALERLEQMIHNFVPPRMSSAHLPPWEEAMERVLSRVCGVSEVEQSLLQLQNIQKRKEKELKKATEEIIGLQQECTDWKTKASKLQMKTERMSLYEKELNDLRSSDSYYSRLVASQRLELEHLEKQNKAIAEVKSQLSAKLDEATAILETTKQFPRHQNQSEWDAVEIANLRAINEKLERELLAVQMENVSVDLDVSDLAPFLPLTSDITDLSHERDNFMTSRTADLTAANSVQKLVEDYRTLREAVLQHVIKTPLFSPIASLEEMSGATKKYVSEHSALRLKLSVLKTRMEQFSTSMIGSPVPAQRFLKAITTAKEQKPAVRITVPNPPYLGSTDRVCKLAATTEQLAEISRRLIGTF